MGLYSNDVKGNNSKGRLIEIGKSLDLIGQRFGRLVAIEKIGIDQKSRSNIWLCKCDCGNYIETKSSYLTREHKKSCGCLKSESARKVISQVRPIPEQQSKIHKKYNGYNLQGEYGIGWTNKNEIFYFDIEDYDKIKDYCWFKNKEGYIVASGGIRVHNIIYETDAELVDDINGKPEDNRKQNLRGASSLENSRNKKG